ncbi:MAG: hypothetical protein U0325_02350 [Polyangiales bacterium]
MGPRDFVEQQRRAQAAFFARPEVMANARPGEGWRLLPGQRSPNLAPSIRAAMNAYFGPPRNIVWHRHADHGLSSQVCCLNFLGPLATRPALLAEIVGAALGIAPPRMLPVEDGPDGEPWFVGFEWIGLADYLGEWSAGTATRGANVTSADAIVRFVHEGRIEALLIEWKYTESYGGRKDAKGDKTRIARYGAKAFAPDGPLRSDLGVTFEDLLWEPFYQLLRQQLLAHAMTRAREQGADRVRVLHISPRGNGALHNVTSPALRAFGGDAFKVFAALLTAPSEFLARTTGAVFGPFVVNRNPGAPPDAWAQYLVQRYASILVP